MTLIFNPLFVIFCSTLLRRILKLCLNSMTELSGPSSICHGMQGGWRHMCGSIYRSHFLSTLFQINLQASSSSKSLVLFISPSCTYIFQFRINSRKIFIKLSPANFWVVEIRMFIYFCLHFLTFLQRSCITFMIKL